MKELINELKDRLAAPDADLDEVRWAVECEASNRRPATPAEHEEAMRELGLSIDPRERGMKTDGVSNEPHSPQVPDAKPMLTKVDLAEIAKIVAAGSPARNTLARVDLKGLMQVTGLKERTARRYITARIIPVYQTVEKGKLIFDVAQVERALKRYRRAAVGDDD